MRNGVQTGKYRRLLNSIIAVTLFVASNGCATFMQVGTRDVKRAEINEGPVQETLLRYHTPQLLAFPTEEAPELRLKCEKTVEVTTRYKMKMHQERVLNRSVSHYEILWEDAVDNLTSDNLVDILLGLYGIAGTTVMTPVYLMVAVMFPKEEQLQIFDKFEQVQYERIPGSDFDDFRYERSEKQKPAISTRLELRNGIKAFANSDGIVGFRVQPSAFDRGLGLIFPDTGQEYIIRREKHSRTVEHVAPWRDGARLANDLVGAGFTLKKIANLLAIGAGPFAIAGAIVVDVATGFAIGYIIDVVATENETQVYYRWTIAPKTR